jgi:uncharacterized protein YerC
MHSSSSKKRKLVECTKLIFGDNQLQQLINRVRVAQLLELGWKQEEIAETVGITRQTVSNIKKKCSFDDVHSFLDDFRSGRPVEYR